MREIPGRSVRGPAESDPAPLHSAAPASPRRRAAARALGRLEALALGGALTLALGHAAARYRDSLEDPRPIPGVRAGGLAVAGLQGPALEAVVSAAAQAALDRPTHLRAGEVEVLRSPRALGAIAQPQEAVAHVARLGKSGHVLDDLHTRVLAARHGIDVTVGFRFDERRALAQLVEIAPAVERPSLATRLDLERRRIEPAHAGAALLAHDALSSVAVGLASGAQTIALPVAEKPAVAEDPLAALGELDIGTVLGSFDTPYSTEAKEADRTFNLKVGATKLSGFVLMPGETFSFNDVVGPRTPENGFRYGGGITGGELVDVLGGGICQVSSTLYGAAFFAGLDIVEHRPHSRPSAYVDMGLDSTVVWPDVDLRLRNPFDFPVVFSMVVRQGKVHAEVLGARRPWQVAFERELVEVLPYGTIWRHDATLRSGSKVVSQRGMRGFKVKRTRKIYQGGELVREEPRELSYPPTSEIVRQGTNPAGATPETKTLAPLRDPAPHLRIVQ
ncbi:MAG: VanW family protein [Nannocystaceae bacterium]|nr:VanW family protein [Nannocystaceae bacterium]